MNEPIPDEAVCEQHKQRIQIRMMRSALWSDRQRQSWVRYFKWYRRLRDSMRIDRPAMTLGYAFALVEHHFSKQTEAILNLVPPASPEPTRDGDQQQADRFNALCASHYRKPQFQHPLLKSKKAMFITGTRVEIDEWQNQVQKARMWGKVLKTIQVPVLGADQKPVTRDGKPVTMPQVVQVSAEIERMVKRHYGFHTRYPRLFDCYFEPDRPTIGTGLPTDCSWFIEDMGELAILELAREKYVDPHDGAEKPLYDFSRMMHHHGAAAEKRYKQMLDGKIDPREPLTPIIHPEHWNDANDYGRENKQIIHPTEGTVDTSIGDDMDKAWFVREMQNDRIVTLANGRWPIQVVSDPWHSMLMPLRVECYSLDPEFIYGEGIIGPIEALLYELQDVHELSVDEFFNVVNGMLAVNSASIVNWDDFTPRSRGKVRIRSDTDVRTQIMPIPRDPISGEMLRYESSNRGFMEFISGTMEGSPGVEGTKQGHKTYRGLVDVQANLAVRGQSVQRNSLINEAGRMASMQEFFNQFLFEPVDVRIVHDDGSHTFARFSKEDIYTEGRPFEFVVEIDPAWGDTDTQRKLALFLFDRAVDYEKLRRELKDPNMRKVSLDRLFERILRKFGHRDTSDIFRADKGEMTPDTELQVLMAGGQVQACQGDLMEHFVAHQAQMQSPNLAKAIQAKKAHPDTPKWLGFLNEQNKARMADFLRDPDAYVSNKVRLAVADQGRAGMGARV